MRAGGVAVLWVSMAIADTSPAERGVEWPGDFVARVEMMAILQTLNADLLSHESATATLERWCAVHRLAEPSKILAERVPGADKPASLDQRKELKVESADSIRYRRVRLSCGAVILSEADNWYVPGRLTPAMNRVLETTDTPFGKAVQSLQFQRHTLSSVWLWNPLPAGWEMNALAYNDHAVIRIPDQLLEHKALLTLPDGTPFSEVVETYRNGLLSFPPPRH